MNCICTPLSWTVSYCSVLTRTVIFNAKFYSYQWKSSLYSCLFILSLHLSFGGKSGRFTWVRLQQPQEQRYPFQTVHAVFPWVPAKTWLPVLGIFNVRTDVKYGLRKRVCTESWVWEKSLAAPGNRTCLSGVPVRRSTNRATSPRLSLVLCGDSLS